MVYLLYKGELPWSNSLRKIEMGPAHFKRMILVRRNFDYINEVILKIPQEMQELSKQIFSLKFHERPPYEELIQALKVEIAKETTLDSNLQPVPHSFEWISNISKKQKADIMKEESKGDVET